MSLPEAKKRDIFINNFFHVLCRGDFEYHSPESHDLRAYKGICDTKEFSIVISEREILQNNSNIALADLIVRRVRDAITDKGGRSPLID